MPIHTFGPGTLTMDPEGTAASFECQVRSFTVSHTYEETQEAVRYLGDGCESAAVQERQDSISFDIDHSLSVEGLYSWALAHDLQPVDVRVRPQHRHRRGDPGIVDGHRHRHRPRRGGIRARVQAHRHRGMDRGGHVRLHPRGMSAGVRVEGAARLRRELRRAGDDLGDMTAAHRAVANIVAAMAQSTAPRRSGELAATVRGSGTKTRASVRAGYKRTPYAGIIH